MEPCKMKDMSTYRKIIINLLLMAVIIAFIVLAVNARTGNTTNNDNSQCLNTLRGKINDRDQIKLFDISLKV